MFFDRFRPLLNEPRFKCITYDELRWWAHWQRQKKNNYSLELTNKFVGIRFVYKRCEKKELRFSWSTTKNKWRKICRTFKTNEETFLPKSQKAVGVKHLKHKNGREKMKLSFIFLFAKLREEKPTKAIKAY